MAYISNFRMHAIFCTAMMLALAWLAPARADDVLDRGVHFHVAASPLASALIEFSTQSGIQVAVADADVSSLQSNGVSGVLPAREALSILLRGTGLEFSRVGVETVAIRKTLVATGNPARAGGSGAAAPIPAPAAAQPPPDLKTNADANASFDLPDVTVIAPRPPSAEELAGNSLYQFIVHHATTPYPTNVSVVGSLTRWRGGRPETLCPLTSGLDPEFNAFVSARLRALAAKVGAPVQSDLRCKGNVWIVFTTHPEKLMGDIYHGVARSLGTKFPDQPKKLLAHSANHAIQGWYITARGGGGVLNTDAALLGGVAVLPLWPLVINTGLHGSGCCYSGIVSVILVVNTPQVVGYTTGSIADYLAMLTLSVVQSPDHCDALPSILDLMSSNCGAREKPTGITAGDLAFLKALYYLNTGLGPSLSRDEIETNMLHQFQGQ